MEPKRDTSFFCLPAILAGLFVILSSPAIAGIPKAIGEEPPAAEEKAPPAKKKPAQPEAKKAEAEKKPAESKRPGKKRGEGGARKEKAEEEAPAKEEENADEAEEEKEVATHTVETEPFKISAKLTGIIEAKKQTPVAMNLDRWTDLTVVSVVPHGTSVKKGDLLLELETKPLEKKIRELKAGMPLKELDLQTAKQDLEKLKKTTPISLEQSRVSMEQAEADLKYFEDVSRPMRERGAKEDVKSIKNYLAYAEEELNQLKKMYEEDDMTEETEEIILQRAQNSVDSYTWMLEQTTERSDRTLKTSLPREAENLQRNLELKEISFKSGEKATKDALVRKELDVEAKVREFEESELALSEYEADFKEMAPKAPHDGVIYYGMNQRGKWTTASTVERKLIPGGKLSMREVAMTVVDPSSVHLRVAVPENKLKGLKKGLEGTLKLQWNPDTELKGVVESVSFVPFADNTFDTIISIPNAGNARIVPGMKGDIEVVIYEKEKAIAVPKAAVEKEGKVETVTMKDGEKRRVKTGQSNGNLIEITQGLKAGDEILAGAPKKDEAEEEKPAAKPGAKEGGKEDSKPEEKK